LILCALEIFLLTYLLTYLVQEFSRFIWKTEQR